MPNWLLYITWSMATRSSSYHSHTRRLTIRSCSFIRFLIRGLVQFMFLTPKPSFLPEPPQNRPYVGAIFSSNLLCLFFHVYNNAPTAGEATRGYMHGGLAMDFIGQKGPTSKIHLLILDILLLLLQLVALGAHVTRIKVKKQTATPVASTSTPAAPPPPSQDLDHEERGLHRSDHDPVDIELQSLNSLSRTQHHAVTPVPHTNDEGSDEREALLSSSEMHPPSDSNIFDAFNSGEIVIADLHLITLIRTQITEYRNAPAESTAGGSLSQRLARGGLGFRLRVGDRVLGV